MARARIYGSNAERQAAYRKRNAARGSFVTPEASNVTEARIVTPEMLGLVARLLAKRESGEAGVERL